MPNISSIADYVLRINLRSSSLRHCGPALGVYDVGQGGVLEDDAGKDTPRPAEEHLGCYIDASSCPDLKG